MRLKLFGLSFLDWLAISLLIFAAARYFVTPYFVERGVDPLVYDPGSNSYASLRCVRQKNTTHQFTLSRDFPELKNSVEIIHWSDLHRYARPERTGRLVEYRMPEPDPACAAARGFVEVVSRWDYHFGGTARADN